MKDLSANLIVKKLNPLARTPEKGSRHASGFDLFACIPGHESVLLGRQPVKIGTGIAIEIEPGFDVQVRPRSGLSLKGVGVTFGTIDSDYRGEILVTMFLFGEESSFEIRNGDRIAQLVINRLADVNMVEAETLSVTERGTGGHGSTGMR